MTTPHLDLWPDAPADAPPDAVFAAVHQPLPLVGPSGDPADERAVLDAFLAPGGAVVALVGPAGAGKTHLLRWLGTQLGPTHHVVRLSGVADRDALLAGFESPAPAPAPARDEAAVAAELLEQVRAALRQRTAEARAACEAAAGRGERPPADERAVAETHGDGLVALLDGPTKDALFRDTPRRKSTFRALVRQLAAGEAGAAEFAAADFEFADVNSARLADPKAQRYVAKLKTNLQGERAAAAALMNAARDAALGALPVAASVEPPDPLVLVREELARGGRELVILHDDYAPGLLDALAATGGPGRCAVRAALATADTPPTATVFSLGAAVVEPEAVVELVTAHLNAARLGAERLAAWFETPDRAAPPVYFADADAFGVSASGISLFPFTRAALLRLAGDGPLNPGRLLRDVFDALAAHRDAYANGELVPAAFPWLEPGEVAPEPIPEPEPVVAEPEVVVEPPREVDAALGALAVRLGRLPVPAPDDVVRFLAAAHTTGADLDLLTPGVLEWLRAHGLMTGLRVRVG